MSLSLPLTPTTDDIAHLETDLNRRTSKHLLDPADKIRQRIIMERAVVRRMAGDLIEAGYELRVNDGEGWASAWTQDLATVMAVIMATDEEAISVRPAGGGARPGLRGTIYLVYGNSGWEVIADNSVNLEPLLAGVTAYCDELENAEIALEADTPAKRLTQASHGA